MRVLRYIFGAIITLCTNTVFAAVCASGQYNDNGVCKTCDIGYFCSNDTKQKCEPGLITSVSGASDVSQCEEPEFSVTTTELTAGTEFSFQMSAKGEFVVDWGDGTAPQTIIRTNTTNTTYSHTYATAGTYTIGLSGQATGYRSSTVAAISFSKNVDDTYVCQPISGIFGSLGAVFGTYGSSQPVFFETFRGCSGLTGSIPENLFKGISGAPASTMFCRTFHGCSGLTGSIPENLFAGINGAPAASMFSGLFESCSGLTGSIPENLFAGIKGAPAYAMFDNTFYRCRGLTGSIPENLFKGISGAPADWMFCRTFSGCIGLTGSIPENLFAGIKGAPAYVMFIQTFHGCSGLTGSIPENLFKGISGAPANRMFFETFLGCSNLTGYIPYKLFSGITGPRATDDFSDTMYNASGLAKKCPANTYQATINTNPSFNSLNGLAICEVCPTGTVSLAGAVSVEQCVCPANKYMNNDACVDCPISATSQMGATSIEQCKKTLSWDADNALSPTSATCGYDTYISLPNTPEKTGYTFSGWTLSTE